jgi:hypothetical protein
VDDILIAPKEPDCIDVVISDTNAALEQLGLQMNLEKSGIVTANDGFKYLGFDIKAKNMEVDKLILEGNFAFADELINLTEDDLYNEDTLDYSKYIDLFVRDTTVHYISVSDEDRYILQNEKLNQTELNKAVNAGKEFGVPALDKSGKCSFAVFDIDINREIILNQGDDNENFNKLLEKTKSLAYDLTARLNDAAVKGYIEFSGYKGYHVWCFWKKPITLEQQKTFFKIVLSELDIPIGLHVEKFPVCSDSQIIKLPLSRHTIGGEKAHFIESGDQLKYIDCIERSSLPIFVENEDHKIVSPIHQDETAPHINAIYKKCALVRYLINKAKNQQYIGYYERTTLLYVYGCLGEEGHKYIHKIMSYCINYDYGITQKFIDKCNAAIPIGCKKMCERFEDVYDKSGCKCDFRSDDMFPSPVIHAMRVDPSCFRLPAKEDQIGHFKQLPIKDDISSTVLRMIDLNKKEYEVKSQQ